MHDLAAKQMGLVAESSYRSLFVYKGMQKVCVFLYRKLVTG